MAFCDDLAKRQTWEFLIAQLVLNGGCEEDQHIIRPDPVVETGEGEPVGMHNDRCAFDT
jgi:hypothetical protein